MNIGSRFALAHAALLCACLGDTPPASPSATADDALERRYFAALCASGATCAAGFGGVSTLHAYGYSNAQCVDAFVPAFAHTLRDYAAGVRLGTMRFDEAAFARCLERVSTTCLEESEVTLSPAPDLPFLRLCRGAFTGVVAAGAACVMNSECAGGANCVRRGSAECSRVCEPLPAGVSPRPCVSDSECPPPATEGAWAACVSRQCVTVRRGPEAPAGQSCGQSSPTGGAVTLTPCAAGHFCALDRTCHRLKALGEPCARGERCEPGAICFQTDAMSSVGRCVSMRLVSGAGNACVAAAYQCALHERLVCVAGTCVAMGEGASCSNSSAPCQGGTYCDRPAGVCARSRGANAPCTQPNQCLSNRCVGGLCASQRCDPTL